MVGLFVTGRFVGTGAGVARGLFGAAGLSAEPGFFDGLVVAIPIGESVAGCFVGTGANDATGRCGFLRRFLTVILQVHFFFALLPVILAVPAFFARTSPFLFTEAIFLFEDFHVIVPARRLIFSRHFFPTKRVAFFRFILGDEASASDGCVSVAVSDNVITPAVRARFIFLFIVIFLSSFHVAYIFVC